MTAIQILEKLGSDADANFEALDELKKAEVIKLHQEEQDDPLPQVHHHPNDDEPDPEEEKDKKSD